MTEEIKQESTPEVPAYTEVEQRALEMGWKPKTEFHGDEVDFIDAKEFVNRKPLFDRIEQQSKQLKNVTRALEALKTHYTKVQETEYNRALLALKSERKQALNEGDGEKFDRIDDQIKNVETQMQYVKQAQMAPAVPETSEAPEVFTSWVDKNRWYNDSRSMRVFADEVGREAAAEGKTPSEVLAIVEKAVRKEFAHKFQNQNKGDAPDLGTSRVPAGRTRGDSFELSDQERQIMNTLIKSDPTRFTREKYIADLKKIKGLE
jgi:regulator of replication initiation timing